MNDRKLEQKFMDYVEGRLNADERAQFDAALAADPAAKRAFEAYQRVLALEAQLAAETHTAHPGFNATVMARVEDLNIGFFRRLYMQMSVRNAALIATVTTATLVFLLVNQPATKSALEFKNVAAPLAEREPALSVAKQPPAEVARDLSLGSTAAEQSGVHPGVVVPQALNREQDSKVNGAGGVLKQHVGTQAQESKKSSNIEAWSIPPGKVDEQRARDAVGRGIPELNSEVSSLAAGGRNDMADAPGAKYWSERPAPMPHVEPQHLDFVPPPLRSSESYSGYIENRRIATSAESISTFSIDVDTASYANSRRFLMSGRLPPRDAVRIEEFLNYFSYNYPVQHEKPFTLSYEIAPAPLESDRYLLKLGIKARDALSDEKPWNLVFLIDVSGSMLAPNKLDLVKSSLKLLVNKMRPNDKLAIVTYAGNAGLVLDSSGSAERARILAAIDSLNAGGSTHGSAGINLAYEVAARNRIQGGVNRVVLATDGDFNVGTTSHAELMQLIENKRSSGITLTTIGVGTDNLKDSMMEQLADKGNGNYFYLDSYNEARKVLETDLVGNIEVVAKDVKLQIEFNPQHVAQYRLIGYENRKLNKEEFNNDQVDAGEIGSGHTVTALYELVLSGSKLAGDLSTAYRYPRESAAKESVAPSEFGAELAFLKIRFKQPDGSSSELLTYPINAADIQKSAEQASGDFRFAAAVGYFGHLLRQSEFRGSYTFDQVARLAEGALGEDRHGYRRDFVQLVRAAASISAGPLPAGVEW